MFGVCMHRIITIIIIYYLRICHTVRQRRHGRRRLHSRRRSSAALRTHNRNRVQSVSENASDCEQASAKQKPRNLSGSNQNHIYCDICVSVSIRFILVRVSRTRSAHFATYQFLLLFFLFFFIYYHNFNV